MTNQHQIFITELRGGLSMKAAAKIAGVCKHAAIRLAREAGVNVKRLQQLRQTNHEAFILNEYAQSVNHWAKMEWKNHPVVAREVQRLQYHRTKTPQTMRKNALRTAAIHAKRKHCPLYRAKRKAIHDRWEARPENRLRANLGLRLNLAIRAGGGCKDQSILRIIGCTLPELHAHITRQFIRGMTWENYGSMWHVDHIVPCSYFDLSRHDEQRRCFHFANLRPLWAEQNCREGDRRGECPILLGL